MSILHDIVINTKAKLEKQKLLLPLENIKSQLSELNLPKGNFKTSLMNKDQAIIAEIKKASPSAGIIAEDFDPVQKAKEYEEFGAAALSILTEEDFFLGSIQYLKDVKAMSTLPILRKDFMVDEYQIYEAKLIGADCILLIASILSDAEMSSFVNLAEELQLDYLIEVHDEHELARVEHFQNLQTFEVDLQNSVRLKTLFSQKNIFVAESGIKNQNDLNYLKNNNINVFLIGESLMRNNF